MNFWPEILRGEDQEHHFWRKVNQFKIRNERKTCCSCNGFIPWFISCTFHCFQILATFKSPLILKHLYPASVVHLVLSSCFGFESWLDLGLSNKVPLDHTKRNTTAVGQIIFSNFLLVYAIAQTWNSFYLLNYYLQPEYWWLLWVPLLLPIMITDISCGFWSTSYEH